MPLSDDDRRWNWFFRSHSRGELEDWTARLRFFRFYRAIGGQANDGDTLRCTLRIDSESDLVDVTSALGISLRALPANEPQPVLGREYPVEEMRKFRSRIESFPRFEQLGRSRIAFVECFAQVWDSRLELQLSGAAGDPYAVTEEDVANAVKVERLLAPLAERVLPPPSDDERCFIG
jgi:hypothetical protein